MGILGVANLVSGRRAQGLDFLEKARAASPDVFASRVWLAVQYEEIGDHARAIKIANEVLSQNPNCSVEYLLDLTAPVLPTEYAPVLEGLGFPKTRTVANG